ncbi:WhiB family transcriptional regulator [Streptomyces sp. NPDC005385]|uniref:WhiB family transcriptional regulator n=1 Tax=Streptomyces sp. NPDC005385 TaxID=3157039 RepID=UPI00339E869B
MPVREWVEGLQQGSWVVDAACAGEFAPDPDDFHSAVPKTVEAAARFCVAYCTVRVECLESQMKHEARARSGRHGVYGGLTADGRNVLAANRRKQAARERDAAEVAP